MKGFFKLPEKLKTEKNKIEKGYSCIQCGRNRTYSTEKTVVEGEGRKKILIVEEYPENDKKSFLARDLKDQDIHLYRDCWHIYAIKCYNEKEPSIKEINNCRQNLFKTIEELKPEKIILFGATSLKVFLADRTSISADSQKEIWWEKWLNWKIPDQKSKCWVYNSLTPEFVNYKNDPGITLKYYLWLNEIINHNEAWPNNNNLLNQVFKITDLAEVKKYFENIIADPSEDYSFDFETTGLKPQKEGHEIICCSITTENETTSFPIFKNNPEFMILFKQILQNKSLKYAHNIKFEALWSYFIVGCEVKNWGLDTMLAAHYLDNREGVTGLKFQTYVNYGIVGYDDKIKPYLKGVEDHANSFNRIKEFIEKFGIEEVLQYCGLDSLFGYELAKEQIEQIGVTKNLNGYNLLHQGIQAFLESEIGGVHIDYNYYQRQSRKLERQIKKDQAVLIEGEEIKQWNKIHPNKQLNLNSNKDLQEFLFDILGYESYKKTKKGAQSTDNTVMEKLSIRSAFCKAITTYKKTEKLKSTYVDGFLNEALQIDDFDYGILRTSMNLNTVKTYRSSSTNPNLQNVPKRDEYAKKLVRTGIIPRIGNKLLLADFSGAEVRVGLCYHKDPVMFKYLTTDAGDMHGDEAEKIFFLNKDQLTSRIRDWVKNRYTFPSFYGSYYKQVAPDLWDITEKEVTGEGVILQEHLADYKMNSYYDFEDHMKKHLDDFWDKKYKVYKKWKEDTIEEYYSKGFIEYKTGFICRGIMKRNEIVNYPIQGSAFHVLLWSYIQLQNWLKRKRMQSKIILQIHDELIADAVPAEEQAIIEKMKSIMTVEVRKHWPWIIVPMEIEMKASAINGNWFETKVIEI